MAGRKDARAQRPKGGRARDAIRKRASRLDGARPPAARTPENVEDMTAQTIHRPPGREHLNALEAAASQETA